MKYVRKRKSTGYLRGDLFFIVANKVGDDEVGVLYFTPKK